MKKRTLALVCLGIGIFLLVQIIMPFISFQLWQATSYQRNLTLASPDTHGQVMGVSVKNVSDFPALYSSNQRNSPASYQEFKLTIPSLKLENVLVKVDSNDFEENLAHLPGTALPGETGNVFITGHSSYPQLFRPGNFKAIFAHLPEIKKGDKIFLNTGNQQFNYTVEGLKIVDPKETSVINPPDQYGRYLTLMTCVPPGFYLKRLVVLAKLNY